MITSSESGRRITTAAFTALAVTSGLAFFGLPVYLAALTDHHGWKVGTVSGAVAGFFVVNALAGVGAARLLRILPVCRIAAIGGLTGCVALAALAELRHVWQLYLVYGLLATGNALGGLVPMTTVVARANPTTQVRSVALAMAGLSVGGIAITPVISAIIHRYGLAVALRCGAFIWLLGLCSAAWLLSTVESSGDTGHDAPFERSRQIRLPAGVVGLSIAFGIAMAAQLGALQQVVKLVEDRDGRWLVGLVTVTIGAAALAGRLFVGFQATRVEPLHVAAWFGCLQAFALVMLAIAGSVELLAVGLVCFGACVGALVTLQPLVIADVSDPDTYASIYARSQLITFALQAGSPYALGRLRDATNSFTPVFAIAGFVTLLATPAFVALGRSKRSPSKIAMSEVPGGTN